MHSNGGKIIEEAINDEAKFYFWEFERKSIKYVVKDLRNSNVCELKLKEALNALPDKEILKDLYIFSKLSSVGTDYRRIMTLSLYDLMDISDSFDDKQSDEILNDDEKHSLLCLDDENPKANLVGWILSNPESRRIALERVDNTIEDENESDAVSSRYDDHTF